jgi:hypothetical protein
MRVKIGPYKNFFGPYQIAEKILFWKDKYEDDIVDKFGRWLSGDYVKEPDQWLGKNVKPSLLLRFCQWVDSKRKRTVEVHIDRYDTWNAQSTLSLIIVPLLKKFKETIHGSPYVDDSDVPEHLRSTSSAEKENEWDIDENHHARWEWVLDELIWTFEQDNHDWESQYYSGEIDMRTVKIEGSVCSQLVDGPNHTFKVDKEGREKHQQRIDNGRRLFAKYYDGLWN